MTTSRVAGAADAVAVAAGRGSAVAADRSRARSTTATRATACGSTPPCRTTPIYAEHWAGHRPVTVTVEQDHIVIRRAGEDADDD